MATKSNPMLDKALATFAEMMINKIETLTGKWQKSWFTEGVNNLSYPTSVKGRAYNGGNAFFLLMACEAYEYKTSVFGTFNAIEKLNAPDVKKGERIHIKKGEKAFPVLLPTRTYINKETGEKIKEEDYRQMENTDNIAVYYGTQVHLVFNIDQTNMSEVAPAMYESYLGQPKEKPVVTDNGFHINSVDKMIEEQGWCCPIKLEYQDHAFYTPKEDYIKVPLREQFVSGEAFYGSLFHEMAHSTGHKDRLNRLVKNLYGDKSYAHEELVAELSAALVAQGYGMAKYIDEDSVPYLQGWLKNLKSQPSYIKNILQDVRKATAMITTSIEKYADNALQGETKTA